MSSPAGAHRFRQSTGTIASTNCCPDPLTDTAERFASALPTGQSDAPSATATVTRASLPFHGRGCGTGVDEAEHRDCAEVGGGVEEVDVGISTPVPQRWHLWCRPSTRARRLRAERSREIRGSCPVVISTGATCPRRRRSREGGKYQIRWGQSVTITLCMAIGCGGSTRTRPGFIGSGVRKLRCPPCASTLTPRILVLPYEGSTKYCGVKRRGYVLSDLGPACGRGLDTSGGTSP